MTIGRSPIMLTCIALLLLIPLGNIPGVGAEDESTPPLPETVTYHTWFGGGSEVLFDHALHMEMGGCAQCHHLEGCGTCHLAESAVLYVSDAKVAMHGACLSCHVQAPRGEDCRQCHQGLRGSFERVGVAQAPRALPRTEAGGAVAPAALSDLSFAPEGRPSQQEIGAQSVPEVCVFLTDYEGRTLVHFTHERHTTEHGIACAACHHLESCRKCHGQLSRQVDAAGIEEVMHVSCVGCHAEGGGPTDCDKCHLKPRP